MAQILVVEDNADVNALLVETLTAEGHEVRGVRDGLAARAALAGAPVDLVVLDLMLPYVDGSVLLTEIRRHSSVPVLVLSARDAVVTKVDLLRLGADDYVTKPFDLTEVATRIEVLLRRAHPATDDRSLAHGDLTLDPASARATIAGRPVALTATELRILRLLLESPDTVRSRPSIYEAVWEEPFVGDDAAVKTHLSNLRAKLRDAAPDSDPIETVWGLGYRLRRVLTRS
ncbi:response regulator transcription factor [Occultella glacieicola]|uniref:Response regulator transcription factor n=1 Tax=Occultella glacieicola TaxID=2518684 RepID=A0ABY2E0C3_9MICO|nr:response regulator transcription factor [Occultella glacieicola]TDE90861.1 response regulator transcription factor [Occultella glacieicola]